MAANWSESEVEAAVADYFEMLRLELTDEQYNKSEHRRALKKRLNERTDGSIELKHQNISAVLIDMGIPYIDGYKPRFNYQRSLLPAAVSMFLRNHPELQRLLRSDAERVPSVPTISDILAAMDEPPIAEEKQPLEIAEPIANYKPFGVDYIEREARNQSLGEAGEEFVLNFERARLMYAGKETLADKVEQVSVTVGPSAGFDIRSFEENGADRFIEAKTTKYGKSTPFYLTAHELDFSRANASQYYLYRVFKFRARPRVFLLHGYLEEKCEIAPTQYLVRLS